MQNDKGEIRQRGTSDLKSLRRQMEAGQGKEAWRSLEELAGSPELLDQLQSEFPRETSWVNNLSRRDFLKILAAPLALAGLSACLPQPEERLMPYAVAPEDLVPGEPLFFATAMELDGYARGLLARSSMGRPIKIEGHPNHPASLGATDVFAQAAILNLYDPERARAITHQGRTQTWQTFLSDLAQAMDQQRQNEGAGLRLLTQTITSPTLASQIANLLGQFPQAEWHQYTSVSRDNVRAGANLAFGEYVETHYRFNQAAVILSLDADFVLWEPGNLRYVRDFSTRRQVFNGQTETNRLYVVESNLTNTGAIADHRLPIQASQIMGVAMEVAGYLGIPVPAAKDSQPIAPDWIQSVVADLQENAGSSLVLAGPQQPPIVHALAHAMNQSLGNVGQTVVYTDPVEANPVDQGESLRALAEDLEAGQVDVLVILEGNPAYTAPADLEFARLLPEVGLSIYLGFYADETAALCDWHLPSTHFLEMWSDTRAFNGTVSLVQPLIQPMFGGKSAHEILAAISGERLIDGYLTVYRFWHERSQHEGMAETEFDHFWRQSLHDGFIAGTASPERPVELVIDLSDAELYPPDRPANPQNLQLVFAPDPSVWDGCFANNSWLQELPRPMTKLVWDNAALISPVTAQSLDLENEDVVELHYGERSLHTPIWILPGLPENSVILNLGYGRRQGGEVLREAGVNAYALRTSQAPWFDNGLEVTKTGERYPLVTTQDHQRMQGRDLVRSGTLAQFERDPSFAQRDVDVRDTPSLYPAWPYEGHAWGMAINLSACTGCNACVIACQAENNVPVVGKREVANAREMHWLRIDRYFQGAAADPQIAFQPVLCMHCEQAPCEPVCPVNATVHSSEGLNEMIYNRCIGTRFCSNNCPYKVRRFNFYQYVEEDILPLKMLRNPDVTVRSRGVIEKCTYCVQRINAGRIQAKMEDRPIRDGEVMTACQQACPANAIVFGDLNDPDSQVNQLKGQPLNYGLLAELGTQPRTTYLARLRNPNPQLDDAQQVNQSNPPTPQT
jgi:MoCo/4Fe-4S cofactor protein with predicted Tat translocation signal